jgi:hypothetical protein
MELLLRKWQKNLRLQDWDIKLYPVEKEWRKTGDIKIDSDDRVAVLMINTYNPKQTNLEELIIHELLHLKLWGLDQMVDSMIRIVYDNAENDPKKDLVYTHFMTTLESTTNDLAKSFLEQGGEDKEISFGRLDKQIKDEMK